MTAETVERKKMYKKGRHWVVGTIVTGTIIVFGTIPVAEADAVPQNAGRPSDPDTTVQITRGNTSATSQATSNNSMPLKADSQANSASAAKSVSPSDSQTSKMNQTSQSANTASVAPVSQASASSTVTRRVISNSSAVPSQASNSTAPANDSTAAKSIANKPVSVAVQSTPASANQVVAPISNNKETATSNVTKAVSKRATNYSFVVTNTTAAATTNASSQDSMTTQTKSFDLDNKTGQISVDTNAVYDSSNSAVKPYTSAVYAPYDASQPATPTFGDQNAVDQRDSAKLGRMLVRITDRQTLGFYVDVPIYGDENTGIDLSKYVGKYLRFKFTQAKQFSGTVVNPSDPTDLYTATLVDDTGKELGPVPESEVSPIVTTPDTKLTDAQLKTSLDSNVLKDSPIANIFKSFGLDKLSDVSLNNLNTAEPSEDSYQKPIVQPDGKIVYQAPKVGIDHFTNEIPIDPQSLPGSNDQSTPLTTYVPVHSFVNDPTTGLPKEILIGYAKKDDYQNSGGLNYTLYNAPNDGATPVGTAVNGTIKPTNISAENVQVTFGATDGATTLPATQTPSVDTGSHFDYTNVIVPDMPTGYELAKAAQQSSFITVGTDATKNTYKVMIAPISEPVSVTFTANNGNKGITKAEKMGTSGTYTTNADYNTTFGKDQLSSISVPDGYSLDSVTPTNKVGLSGTNNYTATIAPKDETVTLTYENTDGKATTMATGTPTTATAKMDSQFGFGNITTMPAETGYTVESKDKQNPDITVATTGNSYTLKLSPDSEPITVSFVADNKNATIAKLKVNGDVKANYNSTFGIKDVKALPGLPTFAGYDYAAKQNDDITVGTANNNYVVQLVAQDENGTVQVVRGDDPTKTVQQSIPFTAKMDSTFGYADVPVAKITAIPGYTLATADKQATGKTIGTDATKNIYQVVEAPDAENVTLNLVKTNDSGKVYKSATTSANMNSSYGITQAKADLTKLKVDVPTGYSLVADNKQAADETIKTSDNAYNVLIAPDVKTVAVSVAATNNADLNIPAFSQTSAVDATFGYGDVDQTKFTVPAGYQLVAKDKQAKTITVNNDETKDTYQVLLAPKTDTKVTVKTALTQSGKQPVTLPADQETTATTDTKYTLADAQSLLGNKLTVNGYHVATTAEKADPDVTVAGNGSSTFTVYLAPDSETLDLKFSALDNSTAADALNAAKVSVAVPFNSTYVFTGHEKGLPALPTGYVYKSYPSADIENTKSNTMTVEIQKKEQPVTIKVVSTNPEDKLPLQGTHEVTVKVDSKVTPSTTGVIDQALSPHYHLAPSSKQVNQPQTVKPTNDNVYEVVLTPDSFSKTVKLLATVRDYHNQWHTIELSNLTFSGLYGQDVTEQTPTIDGYIGESLKATLNDALPDSMMAYVGQEAHLAVHHYLIDAAHHIVGEIGTDDNLFGTVGGDYDIPNDQITGYELVSMTGDPTYTVADEATKGNAINLYYIKLPAQTATTQPNGAATQPTVQVASNEPSYVVTGTVNGKPVSFIAQPVVHAVPADVQTQTTGHVETAKTPKLSETTQSTTVKQSTPSIALPLAQKVAKSSNKSVNLTEPQKPVKSDDLRPVKAEVPAAMKHAQALPQTSENQTGILGMVGAGLMSLLAVFGISKKRKN
ncbi:KxYKxGKxW signal peptide domain-containing protein [Furfurilactobacillus milii]|uniref:LPXTG cell wall anchor domain-containing protein n=1 Tax=Furfurilactobacillus milii TaxID=2888272 RepID=A0A6N9HZD1_9LACO|nr:KxYKxGKxW signal peptide domain-containing protein [Furfurilactobacillus milii]MYV16040.1 LPXTG cell wall anchor domain-containing protein [Furfurilactobacillus milii]